MHTHNKEQEIKEGWKEANPFQEVNQNSKTGKKTDCQVVGCLTNPQTEPSSERPVMEDLPWLVNEARLQSNVISWIRCK